MPFLPVDTAIVVEVGPCIDDTDFKTLETTIAYDAAGMSVDLLENSSTGLTKTDLTLTTGGANDWTHKGNGVYELEITAAQNNTEGTLRVVGVCTGVLPFESPVYTVVPTAIYNSLVAGTDKLQVDAVELGSSTQSLSDLKDFADDGYDPATDKVQGVVLVDTCTANSDVRGTDNAALASVCTEARLAELDAANLPADVDSILADTNELQTDWVNGGRLDLLIDAIKAKTDGLNFTGTDVKATLDGETVAVSATGLDLVEPESGFNLPDMIAVIASAVTGVLSGAHTATITIKAADDAATTRIQGAVDQYGNRTSVTITKP